MLVENDVDECFHERLYGKHSKKSKRVFSKKKKKKWLIKNDRNGRNWRFRNISIYNDCTKNYGNIGFHVNDNLIIVSRVPLKRPIVQRNDELVHNRNTRILWRIMVIDILFACIWGNTDFYIIEIFPAVISFLTFCWIEFVRFFIHSQRNIWFVPLSWFPFEFAALSCNIL